MPANEIFQAHAFVAVDSISLATTPVLARVMITRGADIRRDCRWGGVNIWCSWSHWRRRRIDCWCLYEIDHGAAGYGERLCWGQFRWDGCRVYWRWAYWRKWDPGLGFSDVDSAVRCRRVRHGGDPIHTACDRDGRGGSCLAWPSWTDAAETCWVYQTQIGTAAIVFSAWMTFISWNKKVEERNLEEECVIIFKCRTWKSRILFISRSNSIKTLNKHCTQNIWQWLHLC